MHGGLANTLILALPLLLILVAGVLRVDEHLFASNQGEEDDEHPPRHRFAIADEDGEVVLTDPDGRSYKRKRPASRKRAA